MQEDGTSLPRRRWRTGALLAIAVALIYGLGLYCLFVLKPGGEGFVLLGFLFGVPIAAPGLAVMIWDPKGEFSFGAHAAFGTVVITAMLLASVVFLGEGSLCIIMASPIFYATGIGAAAGTGELLSYRRTRVLSVALVFLPLIGSSTENNAAYPAREETVTTVADIAAPPSIVWKNVVEVRNIQPSELGWTFTQDLVGVPKPVDARLQGSGVGAVRYARWGKGVHFEERIVGWNAQHFLAWKFHFAGDSIPRTLEGHVRVNSAYLKILDGSYTLEALPGGHTRLTLRTHYWMRTPLNAYCAWWGRRFIGDFHANVLLVVRERSEGTRRLALRTIVTRL